MEIIKIKDLSFSYPDTEKKVLDKINININEGEFILLIGESGCGKSTLLRQLKNEIQPYGKVFGEILYREKYKRIRPKKICIRNRICYAKSRLSNSYR